MKKWLLALMVITIASLFFLSCSDDSSSESDNIAPICCVTSPVDSSEIGIGSNLLICADANDPDGSISEVKFYLDNVGFGIDTSFPYESILETNNIEPGLHIIKVIAQDNEGKETSSEISIDFTLDYTITVLQPNGNESYLTDTITKLKWYSNLNENIKIELILPNGSSSIISSSTLNDGIYDWTVPDNLAADDRYKIKLSGTTHIDVNDTSDSYFTILKYPVGTYILLTFPTNGEELEPETQYSITWTNSVEISDEKINIDLLLNDSVYLNLAVNINNTGSYKWTVPFSIENNDSYKIRICVYGDETIFDTSDNEFTVDGKIKISAPNGKQSITKGQSLELKWIDNLNEQVIVELFNSGEYYLTLVDSVQSNGSYTLIIPQLVDAGEGYNIKISSVVNNTIFDYSDYSFKVLSPFSNNNMLFVQGSTYGMGDHLNELGNASLPYHYVTLSDFYMSRTEVTQLEWSQYMPPTLYTWGEGDNFPVYNVSWYETLIYCNKRSIAEGLTPCYTIRSTTDPEAWGDIPTYYDTIWDNPICNWDATGYRLPTEAEWEFAARGGINWIDDYRYSGCHETLDLSNYAWYSSNSNNLTHPTVSKLPNQLGIYDMSGNEWEWCWDWAGTYPGESQINPTGPISGTRRILRGGYFGLYVTECRVAYRYDFLPYANDSKGTCFRVVRRP